MPSEEQEPIPGIARNLVRLLAVRQLTTAQLSQRSEIPEARIEELLAGDVEPTASELLRMAGALGVRISTILEGIAWEADGTGGGSFREEAD
jgi:transcriptional regulator with XRE-family HTH domain